MHNAVLSKNIDHKLVQCLACNWKCKIAPGQLGLCGVRKNINGQLKLLVWNRAAGIAIDPVEKNLFITFCPLRRFCQSAPMVATWAVTFVKIILNLKNQRKLGSKLKKWGRKLPPTN